MFWPRRGPGTQGHAFNLLSMSDPTVHPYTVTETRIGNTFSKFTAIHRAWRKLRGGICRYKTFCMRISARRTFLRFRYCSIHVKIHSLLTYSAVKRRVSMGSRKLGASGIAHERQPNFRHRKKKENRKIERGEFITPPRPTGRRSNNLLYIESHVEDELICRIHRGSLHESGLSFNLERHFKLNSCLHGRLS